MPTRSIGSLPIEVLTAERMRQLMEREPRHATPLSRERVCESTSSPRSLRRLQPAFSGAAPGRHAMPPTVGAQAGARDTESTVPDGGSRRRFAAAHPKLLASIVPIPADVVLPTSTMLSAFLQAVARLSTGPPVRLPSSVVTTDGGTPRRPGEPLDFPWTQRRYFTPDARRFHEHGASAGAASAPGR
jgi:hypothetical protein